MKAWLSSLARRLGAKLAVPEQSSQSSNGPDVATQGRVPAPLAHSTWQASATRQGDWDLAAGVLTGARHIVRGLPCEDSAAWRITAEGALHVALGDGVSTGARGDVASEAFVRHATRLVVPYPLGSDGEDHAVGSVRQDQAHQQVQRLMQQADAVVQAAVAAVEKGRSGATTGVAVWVDSRGMGWCSHVGDCRLYHWREGAAGSADLVLTQVTCDETFALMSEEPPPGVPAHNPARMAGNGHIGTPRVRALRLLPGEGLLLCSDGLHDGLNHDDLRTMISRTLYRGRTVPTLARLLARAARRMGSDDDVGVVVLRYKAPVSRKVTPTVWH